MKPKDYTLEATKIISNLLREVRKIQLENNDLVDFVEKDDVLILLKDKESEFFFQVNKFGSLLPRTNNTPIAMYSISYQPTWENNNERADDVGSTSRLFKRLAEWIGILKSYKEASWTEDYYITKAYEEEFLCRV